MSRKLIGVLAAFAGVAMVLGSAPGKAQNAYITNSLSSNVSVINTATSAVTSINVGAGSGPFGVAVTPDGSKV